MHTVSHERAAYARRGSWCVYLSSQVGTRALRGESSVQYRIASPKGELAGWKARADVRLWYIGWPMLGQGTSWFVGVVSSMRDPSASRCASTRQRALQSLRKVYACKDAWAHMRAEPGLPCGLPASIHESAMCNVRAYCDAHFATHPVDQVQPVHIFGHTGREALRNVGLPMLRHARAMVMQTVRVP